MAAIDVLGIGEPLMELSEVTREGERLFLPGFGGDTSNATIAAARQGAKTAYFAALGDDAFGRNFLTLWQREGVDASASRIWPGERTGIYFISHGPDGHEFSYFRAGSAASLPGPQHLPKGLVESARILHVSGISQAISTSACDLVFEAIAQARAAGAMVSYDTNLRLRLWTLDRARATIHAAVAQSDICLPGLDDAQKLTGKSTADDICDFYLGLGPKIVALTLGKSGTLVATPERRALIAAFPVEAVDATGAGDTFDGAFLAEWLRNGHDPFAAARYANAAAALSTLGYGAVEPIPHRAQVEAFIAQRPAA
jgi:2-dehydro-3-deoxygluconokinase